MFIQIACYVALKNYLLNDRDFMYARYFAFTGTSMDVYARVYTSVPWYKYVLESDKQFEFLLF